MQNQVQIKVKDGIRMGAAGESEDEEVEKWERTEEMTNRRNKVLRVNS